LPVVGIGDVASVLRGDWIVSVSYW